MRILLRHILLITMVTLLLLGPCLAENSVEQGEANCEFYARIGECHSSTNWMMLWCAKSCICPVRNGVVLAPTDAAIDVTPAQDGGIMKEIHRPGWGWEFPPPGAVLYTHYHGQLTNGSRFDASRHRDNMFVFSVGTWFVIGGWEYGLPTMKRGEVATLYIRSEYGYGDNGFYDVIPGGATLAIEVQLFDWRETCSNYNENVTECEIYKSNGGCEDVYWTRLTCRRTCDLCDLPDWCQNIHNDVECDKFARLGECDFNPDWMLVNCARSCAHCPDTSLVEECRDLHPIKSNCEFWAAIGECTDLDTPYVPNACKLTCGLCTPDTPPAPDRDACVNLFEDGGDSRCWGWARDSECVNPQQQDWMQTNCARACSYCNQDCANFNSKCDYWASRGECDGGNRDWMSKICRLSCQRCVSLPDNAIDVTPDQNGGVYKIILREGVGTETPPPGAVIYSHYTGTLDDMTSFGSSRDVNVVRMWTYVMGVTPRQVIEGWQYAVPTMRRGEVAQLVMQSEHGYGVGGTSGNIPSNAVLNIKVELYDWRMACSNVENSTLCEQWRTEGDCESNPGYMNTHCRRACNSCQQPDTCQNIQDDVQCDIWTNRGECDINMPWNRINCARSCGLCETESSTCKNMHPHIENCQYWKSEGECTSEPSRDWVGTHCRHTCDICAPDNCDNVHGNDTECDLWASWGDCASNPWMVPNCAKSCDACDQPTGTS